MKKYITLFIPVILFLSGQMASAQQYVNIPQPKRVIEIPGVLVDANGNYNKADYDSKLDIIYKTITDDASKRTLGDGTVYVLKRNHVYIAVSMINLQFLDIHIKGEDGTGRMPLILHLNPTGGNGAGFIKTFQNTIFENFEFDGLNPDQTSSANRAITFAGANSRVIIKGCHFLDDRGGAITLDAGNGIKLYVYDCLIGNQGHYISYGGNGRALDIRVDGNTGYVDTVVFKNNTIYNLTDRVVRSMGPIVNYMEFDHNTIINNQGVHGSIQFGNTKVAVATNNIFANALTFGDRKSDTNYRGKQQQAAANDPDRAFAIVTLNGTYGSRLKNVDPSEIKMTMRNNNIFFKKEFLDLFAANPTIFSPTVRVASNAVYTFLNGDQAKMSFTEDLAFDYNDSKAGHLGSVSSYKDLVAVTETFISGYPTNPIYLPQNWSLVYPQEWNAAYPTSTQSYTAADGGFPVGDLNWFPVDKEKWMTNSPKSAVNSEVVPVESVGIQINRAYPNPFTSEATIHYSLLADQNVEISIYNQMGQRIKNIRNGYMQQGTYEFLWDGKGGTHVGAGIYFLVISGSQGQVSTKLIKY